MTRTAIKAALALSGLALAAGPLAAQEIVANEYVMINNSGVSLTCRVHWNGAWHEPFQLRPGGRWTPPVRDGGALEIFCDPPAAAKVYRIEPGQRYSWLRDDPNSPVTLRRIVT